MGGKNQTTTQQSTSTPTGIAQLQDIYNRVSNVASQPYTPYQGQMVAGLSDTQKSGIQGVTNAQGAAQPYFDQAAQYAQNGAAAIDPSQIQRYMSPYTQNVIDATKANFKQDNAIGQQQVIGNAAAKGALGGDRVGVAQAELARQQGLAQNPVIAGLYSGAYDKALGAAQQDRSAQAQGAYTFGALAPSVQNAKITGAQAQIGAGGLEQGTNQAGLTAAYNQYLQQLAFPYQQAGFLASAGGPAVNAMGGSTTGTTTQPGPSPWSQVAGIGMTTASFLKDGGVVKGYAGGGPVGLFDIDTYVPKYSGIQSMSPYGQPPALPKIGSPQAAMAGPTVGQVGGAVTGLKSLFGGAFQPGGGMYDANMMGAIPSSVTGMVGGGLKRGGRVSGHHQIFRSGGRVTDKHAKFHATVHAIRQTLRDGGPMHGYAAGGDVSSRFDDAFSPFATPPDNTQPNRDLALAMGDKYQPEGSIELNAGAPMPRPRPFEAPGAPVGSIPEDGGLPPQAMAYGAPQPSPYAAPPQPPPATAPDTPNAPAPPAKPSRGLFGNPFGLSDEARQGLLAAGLGTLASRSPFALSAIGEGGLQGVKSYTEQKASKQKIDSEARKLAQQAEQFAQNLGLHREQLGETKRQHDITEARTRVPPGFRQTDDGSLEAIPGGPQDPSIIKAAADAKRGTAGLIDEETLKDMAGQYLAGDKSVMTNLGRGQQGAENIVKLRAEIARQAREAGMKPDQIATRMADFAGRTAAMRTLGTRGANVEYAANTANKAIDLAQEAYAKLPRGQFVPFNQLRELYDKKTSSPEQAAAYAATNTLVNEYARVASGGSNQATEGMRHHAREMLNTAMSQEAFNAVLGMMRREIQTAKSAYNETRREFLEDHSTPATAKPAPSSTAEAIKIGDRKEFKQGWGVWDGTKYVPEAKP